MTQDELTSQQKVIPSSSIFYFGFHGLSLKDAGSDQWLFGDCGLIPVSSAPKDLSGAVAGARLYHMEGNLFVKWGEKLGDAISDFANVPTNCYLTVRRSIKTDSGKESPTSALEREASARRRAKEISSLLTCVLYYSKDGPLATGLDGEILHWSTKTVEIKEDLSTCHIGHGGPPEPLQDRKIFEMKFAELEAKLRSAEFTNLTSLFDLRNPASQGSLAKLIRAACGRVADGIRSPSHIGELLNAYTAIDMLLATPGKEHFVRRLKMLIGDEEADSYRAEKVADDRNAIMHRGDNTTNIRALQAISLALDALLNAAALSVVIKSRDELEAFLDIQSLRKRLHSNNSVEIHPAESISKINLKLPYFRNKY